MIYTNLLYFIVAILLFSAAPLSENSGLPPAVDVLSIFLALWLFWYYNKFHFKAIRDRFENENINIEKAKKYFEVRSNIHIIIAIFLFSVEIFFFDLKIFLTKNPVIGNSETLTAIAGLLIFFFHLAIIWYWSFRSLGDILDIGESANNYILSNVKFNLVIVLPWLLLSLIIEIISYFHAPWIDTLQNSGLLIVFFLFIIAIFAPLLIIILWDCKPIPEGDFKESILSLSASRGVKFREIMSWNAMNKTLLTAGVVGLIARFRYLLITPQLINLLDREEILAVASHEIGHVKKRHLFLYLLFFVGFIIVSFAIFNWVVIVLISTNFGLSLIVTADGFDMGVINSFAIFFLIILFIVYFRFIFGYFMRSFERQADTYCFYSGIDPNAMISSFMKLGVAVGDDGKKSNWHHYGIGQRIDFLRKCQAEPDHIKKHNRKVNRSLIFFFSALLIFSVAIAPFGSAPEWPNQASYYNFMVKVIEKKIEQFPDNPNLYTTLGMLYNELEKWPPAKKAYEIALNLDYNQPEALNNLAWLLLKCPLPEIRDHKLALKLASDAVRLQEEAHIYDTLAESLLANGMYKEAVAAAEKALKISKKDRKYLNDQLKKMRRLYRKSGSIKI